jgi:hypothetical protein
MTWLLQSKRMGFQKIPQSSAPFADQATAQLQASWSTAQALTTDAKIVIPKFKSFSPELPPTEPVTFGSNDNQTPDGNTFMMGQTVPSFNASWAGLSSDQYDQTENLFAWGNQSVDLETLGVYFFLGQRQVLMSKTFGPIPARNFFIGDPNGMQLHALTMFPIRFDLLKGWFRDTVLFDLSFNHNLL